MQVFSQLLKQYAITGPIVYLDGKKRLTTRALEGRQDIIKYVANSQEETYTTLREDARIAHVLCKDLTEALLEDWGNVVFQGAYLDTCCGSAAGVIRMIRALRIRSSSFVLGYTLTTRDPTGQHITERHLSIERFLDESFGSGVVRCHLARPTQTFTHAGITTRFVYIKIL